MKKILLDTDMGADCDDAGALALLHIAERANLCSLIAVTVCTVNPYAAGAVDAINGYYGKRVPIGQTAVPPPQEDTS